MRENKGFTLLEIIIYTALVAIVLSAMVLTTLVALQIRGRTRAALVLEENLRFAITNITSRVRAAQSVASPSPGVSSDTLVLEFLSAEQNPTAVTLSSGKITIAEGAGQPIPITADEIEITELQFTRISGNPASVTIVLGGQILAADGSYNYTLSLQNTAILRR